MKRKKRKSVPHYTYRESSKASEKAVYKRISVVVLATLVVAAIIWFWGTSFINLLGVLSKPIETTDIVSDFAAPISRPNIKPLPESTNKKSITVEGTTSADQEVTLEGPTGALNTVSESQGSFSFDKVTLKKGLNLIKVYVLDSQGEKLEESIVITYDTIPPLLDIIQPKNGQEFTDKTDKIQVIGKTEEEATVFINNLQAIVNPGGQFTFNYPVKKGTLTLEIKATDKANNINKTIVTVVVSGTKN